MATPNTAGGISNATKILSNTASLDFPNILADASADLTIALVGAIVGDSVIIGRPVDQDVSLITEAFISASGVVTVRAHNVGAVAVDQAAKTYRVSIIRT